MPHWQKDVRPDVVNKYMTDAFRILPVKYVPAKTSFKSMRAQYNVDRNRLQFQFFAHPGEKFPREFKPNVYRALVSMNEKDITVDYVNEAKSWYVEVRNLPMPSPMVAESILKKMKIAFMD